ncbi:general transcription factor 3C polypeptide 6 [Procambarus clarkii]|uniref:general transcription factor 3C polypeptide 6 n=1 Tax=Procambarus clarkii TaxID=6728 RepID=UPI001E673D61|nr:general transcription factor 3C polypeptide 6-like [Procambarus clarkii]
MAESDSEYEEEETLVMVELHGVIDSEIFAQDSFDKFKILSIDSEHPILQVENFVFTGDYEHTMGTAVFFEEEDKRVKKCDPVFCKKPSRMLKYVCKTSKKLTMKRVFISEKLAEDEDNRSLKMEHSEDGDPLATGCSLNVSDVVSTDEAEEAHLNEDDCVSDPLSVEDIDTSHTGEEDPISNLELIDDPECREVDSSMI